MRATLILLLATVLNFQFAFADTPINRVETLPFGALEDGSEVKKFILRNTNGLSVELITYGAILTSINVPDREGNFRNVIAGSNSLETYLKGFPAAAVIGRFANRIANASFEIDGISYQVTPNNRGYHIHGGKKGFAKVNWEADVNPSQFDRASVTLSYFSAHGEEGYPGNLIASVTYELNDANELTLRYRATSDRPTIVNLTNHAYFNLANAGDYLNHTLSLNADSYTVADGDLIPTGEIKSVKGTPLDFTTPQPIGARLDQIGAPHPNKYDDNFIIRNGGRSVVPAAQVYEPVSGRILEVLTDQPGVQLYTGNKIGFCLETQHYPDSIHHAHFPSPILRPGKPFASVTVFRFSVQ